MSEVRAIDANALKSVICKMPEEYYGDLCIGDALKEIDAAPTLDTVVHARWSCIGVCCNHAKEFKCSACESSVYYDHYTRCCDYDFCPNCGAKMDAEEDAFYDKPKPKEYCD